MTASRTYETTLTAKAVWTVQSISRTNWQGKTAQFPQLVGVASLDRHGLSAQFKLPTLQRQDVFHPKRVFWSWTMIDRAVIRTNLYVPRVTDPRSGPRMLDREGPFAGLTLLQDTPEGVVAAGAIIVPLFKHDQHDLGRESRTGVRDFLAKDETGSEWLRTLESHGVRIWG